MAAAAGTALIRSVATKMRGMTASAPIGSCRPFTSSSRSSAVDNKDLCQCQLHRPRFEAMRDELIALRRERSILIEAVEEYQRTHIKAQDDSIDPSQAQITQALGVRRT